MPKTTNLAPEEITNKDVTKAYLRWHFANEIPFERYLAFVIVRNDATFKEII